MGEERDLFSRLYTYEEVQARQRKEKEKPNEKPAHWPDDTVPDPAKWSFWLPDGWGQGLKTTISGKTLRCYIGPPPVGKRFFHKPDIEKYIGYALEKKELPKEDEQGKKVVGSVHDSVPPWPKESDWLPKDWKIGWRHLPTKLHRIYVPPGHDEGFLWHRSEVDEYLAGTRTTLTPIKSSKKMVEISAKAAAAGTKNAPLSTFCACPWNRMRVQASSRQQGCLMRRRSAARGQRFVSSWFRESSLVRRSCWWSLHRSKRRLAMPSLHSSACRDGTMPWRFRWEGALSIRR